MKKENQKAILMLLEEPINSTGTRSKYDARCNIEEVEGNYVLRVQEKLLLNDEILTRDITPNMVLKWSLDNMGDYFGAYLKWFREEKKAVRQEYINKD